MYTPICHMVSLFQRRKENEKKKIEMKENTTAEIVTKKTDPKKGKEEKNKEMNKPKEITVKMVPKTTTIKVSQKTNETLREVKGGAKTSLNTRRPLATKN